MRMLKIVVLFCLLSVYNFANAESIIFTNAKKNYTEGKFDESKKLFITIGKNNTEYADARYYLGMIAYKEKLYDVAIDYLNDAIKANNKNAEFYFMLGNVYGEKAMRSNLVQQALLAKSVLKNYQIGEKIDSTHLGLKWNLLNFYSMAPSIMGGDMKLAYKIGDEINKLKFPDGYEAKGYVYERDGKKDLAEKSFLEAIKAAPKEPKYYYALARFYIRDKKNDKSVEYLEKIIAIKPDEARAYLGLGQVYSNDKSNFEKCLKNINRYFELADGKNKQESAYANYLLGNIYNEKGDKINAKKYYKLAVTAFPEFKEAEKALEKIND